MALNLDERYPGRANPKTLSYPNGSFKNRSSPTSKDGTFLEADWANDQLAFLQSLLKAAGLTANGQVDTVEASQYFDALGGVIKSLSLPFYDVIPDSNVGPIIYVLSRQSIMQWMTIGSWSGYASPRVGSVEYGWTPAPLPWQIDAMGGVFKKADYPALYARFQASGLLVSSAAWKAKEFKICDVSSTDFRAPDLRDQFLRFTGTDADTANARVLGSYQKDSFSRHSHHALSTRGQYIADEGREGTSLSTAGASGSAAVWKTNTPFNPQPEGSGSETRPISTALVPRLHV